jgi:hypothetical protein
MTQGSVSLANLQESRCLFGTEVRMHLQAVSESLPSGITVLDATVWERLISIIARSSPPDPK